MSNWTCTWIRTFLLVSANNKHKFIPHLLVSIINVLDDFWCLFNDKPIYYVQYRIQSIICFVSFSQHETEKLATKSVFSNLNSWAHCKEVKWLHFCLQTIFCEIISNCNIFHLTKEKDEMKKELEEKLTHYNKLYRCLHFRLYLL